MQARAGWALCSVDGDHVAMCIIVIDQAGPMLVSIREGQIGPGPRSAALNSHEPEHRKTSGTPLPFLPIRR